MRHLNTTWLSFVFVGITVGVCPATEDGFVSLFDGQTRNGWTVNHLPKDQELAVSRSLPRASPWMSRTKWCSA